MPGLRRAEALLVPLAPDALQSADQVCVRFLAAIAAEPEHAG
jgi:hypothetical protein